MVVDWVFTFFTIKFSAFGIIGAVCGVSLVINFLALPLYNIADSLQEKERKIAKSMEPRIKRLRMAFKGDERFMMMQAYYRECNYNPIYTLRSSLSILIEIPFFIAAYHYLSHAEALKGVSFWIFKDLGAADALFHIGSFPVNVLPVLMTVINLVSGAVYSKDTTFREKVQIYVLAAIFLVLLYNSPSGLVIYWILNNLFSLAKNVVMKMKNPKRILYIIASVILGLFAFYFLFFNNGAIKKRIFLSLFVLVVICLPVLKKVTKKLFHQRPAIRNDEKNSHSESADKQMLNQPVCRLAGQAEVQHDKFSKSQFSLFIFSALGLALLCGFYLPSSAIATSPVEFSFLAEGTDSPLTYVWQSFFTFLGFFVIWPGLVYFMFGKKVQKWETAIFFVAFLTSLADVFIFKADYGTLDVLFQLDDMDVLKTTNIQALLSVVFVVLACVLFLLLKKFKKTSIATVLILAICAAEFSISISNVSSINKKFVAYAENRAKNQTHNNYDSSDEIKPVYHLTKTGKNVVVLFLDRAINPFFLYALKDIPELKEQMKGFVYFPNTLSFSENTDIASPAMMAGYEYTPENLNARKDELLRVKHNEASLVLPTLFTDADYEVTITDPPCPNYTWKGDLSAFEGKKNIYATEIIGKYKNKFTKEKRFSYDDKINITILKEIKNFSVLQILLPFLRISFNGDFRTDYYQNDDYLNNISCLYYLPEFTDFNSTKNQYIFIDNETTHSPTFLDEDFLLPSNSRKFHGSYKTKIERTEKHYHSFVAAFKQLGKWFNFLKENNAYDNTRIIIVADHGRNIKLNEFSNFKDSSAPGFYTPILLFKDFECNSELSVDDTFMTNADTLFLAKKDLNLSDKNPFTHKRLIQEKQNGITVYPINLKPKEWNVENMLNKTQFTLDKTKAYHVKDNIYDKKNWIPLLEWEKLVVEPPFKTIDEKLNGDKK